ncbi:MAG: hypothetical protein IT366_09540 [Candidatus Hydrogenedentes bacterium]|nr:hypothetical protein [Candidatus Hydrogenedentota bacterium]
MKRAVQILLVWGVAVSATLLLMSTLLPWAGTRGYAGSVIQNNYAQRNDATALFWTESPRTLELLEQIDRQRSNNGE